MSKYNWLCLAAAMASAMVLSACATQLSEDDYLALAYQETERKEAIRDFIRSCEAGGYIVVYAGPSYQRLRDPAKRVPSHARLSDYACTSTY